MNILIFFCGAGVGMLAASIAVILILAAAIRKKHEQPEWSKAQHLEVTALFRERNYLLEEQNRLLEKSATPSPVQPPC